MFFSFNCIHPIWAIRKCTRHTSFDIVFFYAQITKQFSLCCQISNPFLPHNVPWKFRLFFYYGEFKRRLSYNAYYPCTNSSFNFIVHGTKLFGWIDVLIYKHKTSQETSIIFLNFWTLLNYTHGKILPCLLHPLWNHWLSVHSDWLSAVWFIRKSHHFLL